MNNSLACEYCIQFIVFYCELNAIIDNNKETLPSKTGCYNKHNEQLFWFLFRQFLQNLNKSMCCETN